MKKLIFLISFCILSSFTGVYAHEYKLNTEAHMKYMDGPGDGRFNPSGYVSRAEAAQIIYNLMTEKPPVTQKFSDVNESTWYAGAVNALYTAGIAKGRYSADTFYPDDCISRGEILEMICSFYPESKGNVSFNDVNESNPFYTCISTAVSNGWVNGFEDNNFYPDNPLTRAEISAILNRVLKRSADREFISQNDRVRVFTDVEPDHWAYYEITEASVEHTYSLDEHEKWLTYSWEKTGLTPGYHMINHYLYYVEEETGQFSVNCTRDGFVFNNRGRFTTTNAELDTYLHDVIKEICTNDVKSEKNLEAVYFYVRDNFSYQVRQLVPHGATGWEVKYALPMMKSHYGNCYSWASVFMYLTRSVGFESVCQSGQSGTSNADHGWTEIQFDGEWYVFDPEMEYSSRKKGNKNFHKRYYKLPYNNSIRSYKKFSPVNY